MQEGEGTTALLAALTFAAHRHRDQRRKEAGAPPFINHVIEVAEVLARVGGISDPEVLQAAILHDTIEDTDTSPDEIEARFGARVRSLVEEVSDDQTLERSERRLRQVECAPSLSTSAKQIRLADKIVNASAVSHAPPVGWSVERRRDYLEWSGHVVEGCRGCCPALERRYDEVKREGLEKLRLEPR